MPGRTFTVEFKRKVVGELERKEKTIAQLCREHSLADGQIHKWRKLFGEG
jgi:transposase